MVLFVLHNSAVTDTHGAPTQVILVFSAALLFAGLCGCVQSVLDRQLGDII